MLLCMHAAEHLLISEREVSIQRQRMIAARSARGWPGREPLASGCVEWRRGRDKSIDCTALRNHLLYQRHRAAFLSMHSACMPVGTRDAECEVAPEAKNMLAKGREVCDRCVALPVAQTHTLLATHRLLHGPRLMGTGSRDLANCTHTYFSIPWEQKNEAASFCDQGAFTVMARDVTASSATPRRTLASGVELQNARCYCSTATRSEQSYEYPSSLVSCDGLVVLGASNTHTTGDSENTRAP